MPETPVLRFFVRNGASGDVTSIDSGPNWIAVYDSVTVTQNGYSISDADVVGFEWNNLYNFEADATGYHSSADSAILPTAVRNDAVGQGQDPSSFTITGLTNGADYKIRVYYATSYSIYDTTGTYRVTIAGSTAIDNMNPRNEFGVNNVGMREATFTAAATSVVIGMAKNASPTLDDAIAFGAFELLEVTAAGAAPFVPLTPIRRYRQAIHRGRRVGVLRLRRQNFAIDPTLDRPEREDGEAKARPRQRRAVRRGRIDITESIALTETPAGAYTVTADAGAYAVTGQDASLEFGYAVDAAAGSYTLTGSDAALEFGFEVAADAGAYTLTGQDASLEFGREVAADAGSYGVTGQDASLEFGYAVDADAGTYTFTGQDASLVYEIAGEYTLAADAGSYTITGADAGLEFGYAVDADLGAYALTGQAASLEYGFEVTADAGSFAFTGAAADLEFGFEVEASAGSYDVTGADAALVYATPNVLAAESGAYTLTGTDADLEYAPVAPVETVSPRRGGGIRRTRAWQVDEDEEDKWFFPKGFLPRLEAIAPAVAAAVRDRDPQSSAAAINAVLDAMRRDTPVRVTPPVRIAPVVDERRERLMRDDEEIMRLVELLED